MKKITLLLSVLTIAACGGWGCSTVHKSDTATLQGTWKGHEVGGRSEGLCTLTITGRALEFRGADQGEWYKATFTVRKDQDPCQVSAVITECSVAQYVGKTTYAVFRLEGGTLTFAGNEPGSPEPPTGLDAPNCRRFVMTKD